MAAPGDARAAGQVQSTLTRWDAGHDGVSALVWRLDEPQPVAVAASAPDRVRIPASTMKLVTSAGALLTLGPRHRFQTTVLAAPGTVRDGKVLRGRVILRGGGDPVLSTAGFARANFDGMGADLDDLGRVLRRKGIRRIQGPIVGDGSAFDRKRVGPRWRSYYAPYASPLSGLSTNKNLTRTGRHASAPERTAAARFRATLQGLGIRQRGGVRVGPAPPGSRTLARVSSPPLARILPLMNGPSDNFLAEMLAKSVAAGRGEHASSEAGTARIAAALAARGILGPRDRVVDGSGLSRANRLSATTLVRLIAAADADPSWGRPLLASLPRGGTGTLRSRLRGVGVRVQAKTGYLNGASALAGRVASRRGQRYAFAVVVNGADAGTARTLQDRVVGLLAAGVEDRPARTAAGR